MRLRPPALAIAAGAAAIVALSVVLAHSQAAATLDRTAAYKPDAGPYRVRTIETTVLHDTKRGKDLAVKVYHPDAPGPFPVIVFSHGFGGSKEGAPQLGEYWASHGYVTLHPTHADSGAIGEILRARLSGQRLRDGVEKGINAPDALANRARDVSLVIDSLREIEKRHPELAGRLDRGRIGVGGHSFGAGTATVIGGAALTPPGVTKPLSLADKRVACVLALSGQGKGQMGFTADSWKGIRVPFMSMTGSKDMGMNQGGPNWKREAFDGAPSGGKYHVYIEGATHASFVGNRSDEVRRGLLGRRTNASRASSGAVFGSVKCASLAFWDAHLKRDAAARKWLASDALTTCSRGIAGLSRK